MNKASLIFSGNSKVSVMFFCVILEKIIFKMILLCYNKHLKELRINKKDMSDIKNGIYLYILLKGYGKNGKILWDRWISR